MASNETDNNAAPTAAATTVDTTTMTGTSTTSTSTTSTTQSNGVAGDKPVIPHPEEACQSAGNPCDPITTTTTACTTTTNTTTTEESASSNSGSAAVTAIGVVVGGEEESSLLLSKLSKEDVHPPVESANPQIAAPPSPATGSGSDVIAADTRGASAAQSTTTASLVPPAVPIAAPVTGPALTVQQVKPGSPASAAETNSTATATTTTTAAANTLKFFVGGIHPDALDEDVLRHFESFGKVKEVQVLRDGISGRNRGFGFITMEDDFAKDVIFDPRTEHSIKCKKVEVRYMQPDGYSNLSRKIFIGGINPALGEDVLQKYFEQFGEIEKVTIMRDTEGRSRGFGFVVYVNEESVKQVLTERQHSVTSCDKVDVRRAEARGRGGVPSALPPGFFHPRMFARPYVIPQSPQPHPSQIPHQGFVPFDMQFAEPYGGLPADYYHYHPHHAAHLQHPAATFGGSFYPHAAPFGPPRPAPAGRGGAGGVGGDTMGSGGYGRFDSSTAGMFPIHPHCQPGSDGPSTDSANGNNENVAGPSSGPFDDQIRSALGMAAARQQSNEGTLNFSGAALAAGGGRSVGGPFDGVMATAANSGAAAAIAAPPTFYQQFLNPGYGAHGAPMGGMAAYGALGAGGRGGGVGSYGGSAIQNSFPQQQTAQTIAQPFNLLAAHLGQHTGLPSPQQQQQQETQQQQQQQPKVQPSSTSGGGGSVHVITAPPCMSITAAPSTTPRTSTTSNFINTRNVTQASTGAKAAVRRTSYRTSPY